MDHQQEYNQMMREPNSNQQVSKYIIIAVVAFVLGFGSAWISFKGQGSKVASLNDNESTLNTSSEGDIKSKGKAMEAVPAGSVVFRVLDQAPAKSVFVAEVSTTNPLWVVITEDSNGVRGNIIGAGLFDKGESAGVVELLRGTVEGGTYYAILYHEDSELTEGRSFDLEIDVPLLDSNGNALEVRFKTTSLPQ